MKSIKFKKLVFSLLGITLLAGCSVIYLLNRNDQSGYVFETVKVEKGRVNITITATGTLEATNTVVVGTQVSGVVEKLYVDFNSIVKKGQLIAELDKSTLQSSLENAEADLDNAQAEFDYQKSNLIRIEVLYNKEMLAESDYDLAMYHYKKAQAGLKSAKANLNRSQRNLSYAMIYSPIDGIVLNRAVEEGQTVAASMNTPELFTITNDLSEMQVEADVDEADIGMVKEGQRVEFTVDAFPDETFLGEISEVRLQPTESSNVITYTVIVAVSNPEQKLKPGMTASITDYVKEANDVLLMAGKAIRFMPERDAMEDYVNGLSESKKTPAPNQRPEPIEASDQAQRPQDPQSEKMDDGVKRVWVKQGEMIKPVKVEIGINDGLSIEILSGLQEGDLLVTSMEKVHKQMVQVKEETQKSPFVQESKGGPGPGPR